MMDQVKKITAHPIDSQRDQAAAPHNAARALDVLC